MVPVSKAKRTSRAEYLFLAKLAEEAERYDDILAQMKALICTYDARLTVDERNLLSVAYKNITNTLRSSWRAIESLEKSEFTRASQRHLALMRQQRSRILSELTGVCKDIVRLLDDSLIPAARTGEETVFYWKMKGDYYRYLAEILEKQERVHLADLSLNAYKSAYKHALAHLEATHPTRLGLALNFSVYYHDVRKSPDRACHLAKHAFDEAVACLEQNPSGQTLTDSVMILQLLRDDLVLWFGEMQKESLAD